MGELRVSLFGKFSIHYDEQFVKSPEACKARELFCYLLLHRNRPYTREILSNLLWGNQTALQSKSNLRKALWQLQNTFDVPKGVINGCLLTVEANWIQLNTNTDLWLDVEVFEEAFNHSQNIPGWQLNADQVKELLHAVELYKGDLLDGWYHDWCLYNRERLQSMYLIFLDKLMAYSLMRQEYDTGLVYAMRILQYDPAREHTHRDIMRLYALAGNRTEALRQYKRCITILSKELEVDPSRKTVALYEQIRTDQPISYSPFPEQLGAISIAASLPLTELLDYLEKAQDFLENTQIEIQQCVNLAKAALHKDLDRIQKKR